MSNDLLFPRWEKKPRTNYVAKASNGKIALRSSHAHKYSFASVCINSGDDDDKFIYWASFHRNKELADRVTKSGNKHGKDTGRIFETIELEIVGRKEFAKLSRMRLKEIRDYREQLYNERQAEWEQQVNEAQQQQETELENV